METLHAPEEGGKRCSKCGNVLPISEFYVKIKATGRRFSWCRTCHAVMCKRVPDGVPARLKPPIDVPHLGRCRGCKVEKLRSDFPHQFSAYCSACVESYNPKEAQQRARKKHRSLHIDRVRQQARERYQTDPRYGPELQRKWRAANPERSRLAVKKWRSSNKDAVNANTARRRARLVGAEGSFTVAEWREIERKQDYRCLYCNKREPEIQLTIDHIIPLSKGGSNFASNLQGLCKSCNCRKHTKLF